MIPKIKIKYSRFLDSLLREFFLLKKENKDKALVETEDLFKNIEGYKKEWVIYEKQVLTGLLKLLPTNFYHSVIDVYIVSYWPLGRGSSEPIIIRGTFRVESFINVLIHEIIHFFLSNNNQKIFPSKLIKEMFPSEKNIKTINHIIVSAIEKYIYLDILKDNNRFVKEKEKTCRFESYKKAWDIVEERGYMELINEFKNKIELSLNKKQVPLSTNEPIGTNMDNGIRE